MDRVDCGVNMQSFEVKRCCCRCLRLSRNGRGRGRELGLDGGRPFSSTQGVDEFLPNMELNLLKTESLLQPATTTSGVHHHSKQDHLADASWCLNSR